MFTLPPWLEPRTAYLHIPFCGHHCGYCDFAVAAGQDHLIELYLDAIDQELQTLHQPRPVETIFIGGGTPTYLNPDQLRRLLQSISNWLPFVDRENREYSIESTPESLNAEKLAILAEFGVNRISIGAQSFHPQLLAALDRRHRVDHIPAAVELVRQHRLALSFDLIFAIPGQTHAEWHADLLSARSFEPEHISTYGLTYEKGTPLWKERERGAVKSLSDESELRMYEHAMDELTATGFEHYEISNFAKPYFRCRHNERYWANEAYYGFGVGAARYLNGIRELNLRDTQSYIRRVLSREPVAFQREQLSDRERAFETIAIQLRRSDGIERTRFREQTGFELDELIRREIDFFIKQGLLETTATRVFLTRRGKCLADGIVERMLRAQ